MIQPYQDCMMWEIIVWWFFIDEALPGPQIKLASCLHYNCMTWTWESEGSMTEHPPTEEEHPTPSSVSHPWHCLWSQMSHHSYRTICHSKLASISQSPLAPVLLRTWVTKLAAIQLLYQLKLYMSFYFTLGNSLQSDEHSGGWWVTRRHLKLRYLNTWLPVELPMPPTVFQASPRLSAAAAGKVAVSSILETTPSWGPTCTWTH